MKFYVVYDAQTLRKSSGEDWIIRKITNVPDENEGFCVPCTIFLSDKIVDQRGSGNQLSDKDLSEWVLVRKPTNEEFPYVVAHLSECSKE
jgi:hypothetical protein